MCAACSGKGPFSKKQMGKNGWEHIRCEGCVQMDRPPQVFPCTCSPGEAQFQTEKQREDAKAHHHKRWRKDKRLNAADVVGVREWNGTGGKGAMTFASGAAREARANRLPRSGADWGAAKVPRERDQVAAHAQ